jgi:hypothetical protein
LALVLKIKPTDRFLTRAGGLKKAVITGLAGVTLAATLSLAATANTPPVDD